MAAESSLTSQYIAGLCVNIISISSGAFTGWGSASFLELQADDSPLESGPMSHAETGWVGAIFCIGGLIGNIFFAWFAEKIGRKRSLLLCAVPSFLGWICIYFAQNPFHLAIARLLGGIAGGGIFVVIPIYVTEFSEDRVRGALGSLLVSSCNFGILIAFILGAYFSYARVAMLLASLPVIFALIFYNFPETPQYLIVSGNPEKAEKALRYFRNVGNLPLKACEEFAMELEQLQGLEKKHTAEGTKVTWQDFSNRTARKALTLGVGLVFLNVFCGCFAMINYTAIIFQQSGSNLSPNVSAIIVGFIQIVGSYMATVLVERAGRKLLLTISAIGTAVGLLCLGLYSQLTELGYDTHAFNWVPVTSFAFTIFIACWGVLTLPFLVLSEIMPPKIRSLGCMFCMSLVWIFAFFLLIYFPILSVRLGMHGVMFFFAGSCLLGAAFLMVYLPETKGRSIETILSLL